MQLPPHHKFAFPAMNTEFSVRLCHSDREEAERLAGNAFVLLEDFEGRLSRFREDSEVSRINRLGAGESLFLSEPVYDCLKSALEAGGRTAGLFDVSAGSAETKAGGRFALDPDRPRITCIEAGSMIDLGGIGKGYALDAMARLLADLDAPPALLSAGASTHLAAGAVSWPMELAEAGRSVLLRGRALSSSGTGIQGAHVRHPDTGEGVDYAFTRVWVLAPDATLADAFSTACLLMDEEELQAFAEAQAGEVAIFALRTVDGQLLCAGIPDDPSQA